MAQNKTKMKNNKIALEVSFSRKSSLKICEIYVNLTNSNLDSNGQLPERYSTCESRLEMKNKILLFIACFGGDRI